MGMERCKRRARDIIFWPRMNDQIDAVVSCKCKTCQEHQMSNQKEPMMQTPMPTRPWQMVATDLFQWEQKDYMVVVDYYSRYVEIAKMEETRSQTIVNHTKSIFARHGIPTTVRSDNGPQYTAKESKLFAQQWKFEHQTSSPYYPKANGLAEKAVQIVKRLLSLAKQNGKDPYLSLLECRNTPVDNVASPAQILMSRRLRSHLQITDSQLQPQVINPERMQKKLEEKQAKQKRYYDRGSRQLPVVREGEKIRVQLQNKWKPAVMTKKLETPRSYIVQTSTGQKLRRNRHHIRKRKSVVSTTEEPIEESQFDETKEDQENINQERQPETSAQEYRTRSGRVSKQPERFQAS